MLWPIQSFRIRGWRDAEIVFGQCHGSSSLLPWWVCSVQCHYSCFLKGSNWQILLKAFVKGSSGYTARTKNWTELKIEYVTHLAKAAPLFVWQVKWPLLQSWNELGSEKPSGDLSSILICYITFWAPPGIGLRSESCLVKRLRAPSDVCVWPHNGRPAFPPHKAEFMNTLCTCRFVHENTHCVL